MRFGDPRRGKGKRGGLRVIYYWWTEGAEFWLFTLYDKDEASDLTPGERKAILDALAGKRAGKRILRTHKVEGVPVPEISPEELVACAAPLNSGVRDAQRRGAGNRSRQSTPRLSGRSNSRAYR